MCEYLDSEDRGKHRQGSGHESSDILDMSLTQRKIITRRKQHHHSGKYESKIRIQNMILPRGKEQHRHLNKNLKTSRMVGMNSAVGFALQVF